MKPSEAMISPAWYAAGSILTVPFAVVVLVFMAALIFVAWPAVPFLAYSQRKLEIAKANAAVPHPADEAA